MLVTSNHKVEVDEHHDYQSKRLYISFYGGILNQLFVKHSLGRY